VVADAHLNGAVGAVGTNGDRRGSVFGGVVDEVGNDPVEVRRDFMEAYINSPLMRIMQSRNMIRRFGTVSQRLTGGPARPAS
jgi:hypothetical protein